ncbi:hypothetical protein HPULCUR_009596 [Helicostylum pulchrum]|uniref:Uncharacterized protein n=1 Tax=Helicostylum pulchrum TaxID=562976 RepID=A0ABP9YBX2_9FUNG
MTEYKNRAERRRFQRVELRKIRTEYKQQMKAFSCLDYNEKKFNKTVFYRSLEQVSQINAVIDTPATGTNKEEGPSPPADTAMAFYNYECAPEDNRIRGVYDRTDQAVEGIVYEEEYIQDNMLQVVLGNIEQVTEEGILVAEMSKVEDSFIQPDATTRPLTADIEIATARNIDCSQEVVYSSDDTSVEDKDYAPFTSVQANDVSEAREARKESVIEDTLGSKDVNISAGKEECDVKEAPSFETGTFTSMADQEDEAGIVVKEVGITQVVNSFKLRWNLLPVISLYMFDCSLNTPCEIQAFVNVLGNAAGGENTEVGEDKKDTEELLGENEDDVQKDDEAGQQQEKDERALVLEKKINHSFCEKYMKEVAWMVASPCSIMRVICEDKTSLLVTPPQSITGFVFNRTLSVQPSITSRVKESEAVTAFRGVTFSPVEGVKRKRLRNLKVSFHLKRMNRAVN